MSEEQTLTLLIPVFNGENYLKKTFLELEDFFADKKYLDQIIFIDDGSNDNSFELISNFKEVSNLNIKIARIETNSGKGAALKKGMTLVGDSDFVGFTDIELPFGLEVLDQILDKFDKDLDTKLVSGNRKLGSKKQYSFYRKFYTVCFRVFIPKKLRKIPDTQCGLKVFRASEAKKIFSKIKTNRWVFDLELFLIALENSYKIDFVPVSIKSSCVDGKGGVSFLRHGAFIISDLNRIRKYQRNGYYSL